MPSSSTRSTLAELNLLYLFRQAVVRLSAANMSSEAHNTSLLFAEILDISQPELMAHLKPTYHPDYSSVNSYKIDMKQWDDLIASNNRMRRSGKICNAGNALADVGAALFKVGRDAEAAKVCEWGNWLWQVSVNQYQVEEKYKYGSWNGGDYDVEMG